MDMTNEEAQERIAEAQKRAGGLADWIGEMSDNSSVLNEEDADLLAFILSRASEANPTILLQAKLFSVVVNSCFYAGYRKGLEVGELNALLKREGG